MTTTRAPDYVNGLITNWIPLTTPGPGSLLGECSSAIYVVPGSNTELVAFDPYYGHFIDTAVQCLATQQSLWWNQHSDGVTTDINLGPFNCPTGYTTASASTVNSQTTFVGCCPSSYNYAGSFFSAASLGQCLSAMTTGQVITAKSANSVFQWNTTEVTITTTGINVFGAHINGFIFNDDVSPTSPASASATTSSSPISTSGIVQETNMSTSIPSSQNGGLSTGAKIGIGVGAPLILGFILALMATIIIVKRRQYRRSQAHFPYQAGIAEVPGSLGKERNQIHVPLVEAPNDGYGRYDKPIKKENVPEPVEMWVEPREGG